MLDVEVPLKISTQQVVFSSDCLFTQTEILLLIQYWQSLCKVSIASQMTVN